ncbi:MAG: sugar phosphate isomerase/epimerase family protein [Gilvibacter sp.]
MTQQRFSFKIAILATTFCLFLNTGCKQSSEQNTAPDSETNMVVTEYETPIDTTPWKLSLAQWSIHRMIQEEGVDPFDFAKLAAGWGFEGVEYVSQLYNDAVQEYDSKQEGVDAVIARLKEESEKAGVTNLLIMIDGEGDMAVNDETARDLAVANHKVWVDAAAALGCHSIRVNLFGSILGSEWHTNSVDALTKLGSYAKEKNINVLVENHGWLSSDAPQLMKVINEVAMDNVGTLPDFGNFCLQRKDGSKWGECLKEYPDIYQGVNIMMPAAKAVSAKSYDFDALGNETKINYAKMLRIVKANRYDGFIGVEYEGTRLSEEDGILATKNLILNGPFKAEENK